MSKHPHGGAELPIVQCTRPLEYAIALFSPSADKMAQQDLNLQPRISPRYELHQVELCAKVRQQKISAAAVEEI